MAVVGGGVGGRGGGGHMGDFIAAALSSIGCLNHSVGLADGVKLLSAIAAGSTP